ncbi:MAG TPA: hypothetical protein VFG73_10165 [Rhodanobacteraceae bacterium]|nr:hypothetical protein [Rhodanobacteraceae bacterium]
MNTDSKSILQRNSVFGWIAAATGLLLLIPFIAMRFTSEVNWDATDFIVMGCLVFGIASLFVLTARLTPRKARWPIAVFFVVLFLYLWAELAVGIFTNWGS